MDTRQILYEEEMRSKIIAGAKKIYDAVRITMGSKGRNVIYERKDADPLILNDGVRIAREVILENRWEKLGADLLRQASEKTNRNAGDGTTLTVVLAYAILAEGLKAIKGSWLKPGANPVFLKREIQNAARDIVKRLKELAQPVESFDDIRNIATISSQSKEIGKTIAEIIEEVGRDMPITVEVGSKLGIHKKIIKGVQFDKGYVNYYYNTDPRRMEFNVEGCHVVVIDERISTLQDVTAILTPLIEGCQATNRKRNILIICEDAEIEAHAVLLENHMKGKARICVVQPPGMGQHREDFMEDIALITGATYIGREAKLNLKHLTYDHFGYAEKIIANAFNTTIIGGSGHPDDVARRMQEVQTLKEQADDEFLESKLDERISKLKGHVGILQIKASTDSEQEEMLLRIEDAVLATKSAIAEGIVPGGGKTLINCAKTFTTVTTGDKIIDKICHYPMTQIVQNAGLSKKDLEDVQNWDDEIGYNTDDCGLVNLFEDGIVDPAKVIREALENASSIATMLLTTGAAMIYSKIETPKKDEA